MASPRPRPWVAPPAWRNGSNTWGRKAELMPRPVSVTVSSARSAIWRRRTTTRPAGGGELMAVAARVPATRGRRAGAPGGSLCGGARSPRAPGGGALAGGEGGPLLVGAPAHHRLAEHVRHRLQEVRVPGGKPSRPRDVRAENAERSLRSPDDHLREPHAVAIGEVFAVVDLGRRGREDVGVEHDVGHDFLATADGCPQHRESLARRELPYGGVLDAERPRHVRGGLVHESGQLAAGERQSTELGNAGLLPALDLGAPPGGTQRAGEDGHQHEQPETKAVVEALERDRMHRRGRGGTRSGCPPAGL